MLISRLALRLFGRAGPRSDREIGRGDFSVVKGAGLAAADETVAAVLRHSRSAEAGAAVGGVEREKRALADRLGRTPADPRPLPATLYETEAQAVYGLATPPAGLRLLYGVVRAAAPRRVVEIGGAHGLGAALMALAMRDGGGAAGQVITLEGMTVRARLAEDFVRRVNAPGVQVVEGLFQDTLAAALATSPDLVFSDGDKGAELTRWHSGAALDALRGRGGWLLFDDINHTPEIGAIFRDVVGDTQVEWAVTIRDRWALLRVTGAWAVGVVREPATRTAAR